MDKRASRYFEKWFKVWTWEPETSGNGNIPLDRFFLSFPGYLTSFLNYSSFLEFHLNCSYLFLLKTSKPGDYPILSLLSESIFSQSPAPHWLFPARSVRFSSAPNPINIFYLVPLELLILIELILGTTHLVKDFILIFYITKILTLFDSTLYQLRKI